MKNNPLRILLLLFTSFIGAKLFYIMLTFFLDLGNYMLLPLFAILSILVFIFPIKFEPKEAYSFVRAVLLWMFGVLIFLTFYGIYHLAHNHSKVVLKTAFYWDYGLKIDFRENGTYRAENEDWVVGEVSYGNYEIVKDTIVCRDLRFGSIPLKPRLWLSQDSTKLIMELQGAVKGISGAEMDIVFNTLF